MLFNSFLSSPMLGALVLAAIVIALALLLAFKGTAGQKPSPLATFLLAFAFGLVASIGFVGCATTGIGSSTPLTQHQQIEKVCIGVSASYAAAAVLNDRSPFSKAQQDALTRTSATTDKVCEHIPNSWAEVAPEFAKAVGDAAILSQGGTPR
jgi:hypothetical protein